MSFPVIDTHFYAPNGLTEGHQRGIKSSLERGLVVRVHAHKHGEPCSDKCQVLEPERG